VSSNHSLRCSGGRIHHKAMNICHCLRIGLHVGIFDSLHRVIVALRAATGRSPTLPLLASLLAFLSFAGRPLGRQGIRQRDRIVQLATDDVEEAEIVGQMD
jgi:hypothetical protein